MMMQVLKKRDDVDDHPAHFDSTSKKLGDDSLVMGMKMTMIRMIKMINSIVQSTLIKIKKIR